MAEIPQKKETDWITPVAIGAGAAGLGVGAWMYFRQQAAKVTPGDTIRATVSFDYAGEAGDYVIQIAFGTLVEIGWQIFNREEGMIYTFPITLEGPNSYQFDCDCEIPIGANDEKYDAEFQIKTPGMTDASDFIQRKITENAIEVES